MKTLLFCTAYFGQSIDRYIDWVNYYKEKLPDCEMLLVHDGPIDVDLKNKLFLETEYYINDNNLKEFETKLLHQHPVFPSWWRSFMYALKKGKTSYDKIIHIESDAYIFSKRLLDYLDTANSGWISLYSKKHGLPESAIQIINKDAFNRIDDMPEMWHFEKIAEFGIPFTKIEKSFIGDRYGEDNKLPRHSIDYACQWSLNWYVPEEFIIK